MTDPGNIQTGQDALAQLRAGQQQGHGGLETAAVVGGLLAYSAYRNRQQQAQLAQQQQAYVLVDYPFGLETAEQFRLAREHPDEYKAFLVQTRQTRQAEVNGVNEVAKAAAARKNAWQALIVFAVIAAIVITMFVMASGS